jgi:glutaredoxin 3
VREVTLYTTPSCGFCVAAKRLLGQKNIPFKEVGLADKPELRQRLSQENGGYRTVPMIFIGEEFIGGFDELNALSQSGGLDAKLQGA